MKHLTNIKLINWGSYSNITIPVYKNTIIVGGNGSGKTTCGDAIISLLSTESRSKSTNYNHAASPDGKSQRTLLSYVLGERKRGKPLRINQDITTYVCFEYTDEFDNSTFLAGLVVEYSNEKVKIINKCFFILTNTKMEDNLFIEDGFPLTKEEFETNIKSIMNEIDCNFFDKKNSFLDSLKQYLDINNMDYFRMFSKASAFSKIEDIDQFVFELLVTKSDLKSKFKITKDSIEKFGNIKISFENLKKEIKRLEEIQDSYSKYLDLSYEFKEWKKIKNALTIFALRDESETLEKKHENNMLLLTDNLNKLKNLEKEIASINSQLETLGDSDDKKTLDELEKRKNSSEINLRSYKKGTVNKLFEELNAYCKTYNLIFQEHIGFNDSLLENDPDNLISLFTDTENNYTKNLDKISEEFYHLKHERNILEQNIHKLENKKRNIEIGKKDIPAHVNKFIEELGDYFQENNIKCKYIKPFCDCFEIKEESWRDCIEGYINKNRFNVLVPSESFNDALKFYNLKESEDLYKITLVDLRDLNPVDSKDINPMMLDSHLYSGNEEITAYLHELYGNILAIESKHELSEKCYIYHKAGISKDCYVCHKRSYNRMNPFYCNNHFIGSNLQKQLQYIEQELDEKKDKYRTLIKQMTHLNKVINESKNVSLKWIRKNLNAIVQKYNDLSSTFERDKNNYNVQLDLFLQNDLFKDDRKLIKSLSQQKDVLCSQKNEVENTIEEIQKEIANYANIQNGKVDSITRLKSKDWDNDELKLNAYLIKVKDIYCNVDFNLVETKKKIDNNVTKFDNDKDDEQKKTQKQMKNYSNEYSTSFGTRIDDIDDYLARLNDIKLDGKLDKLLNELNISQNTLRASFQNDFLGTLRNKILETINKIKLFNKILERNTFKNERFQFEYKWNSDEEFKPIVQFLNIKQEDFLGSNFEVASNASLNEFLENLIERVNYEFVNYRDKGLYINEVDKFFDERQYLSFDLYSQLVDENGKSVGEKAYCSRYLGTGSGGELRLPYYIVMACAFSDYSISSRKGTTSGCVVLMDEVFDGLDPENINATLNFYSNLNLQLIMISPKQGKEIIPYIDTCNVIENFDGYSECIPIIRNGRMVE